jgi:hypothetical protein
MTPDDDGFDFEALAAEMEAEFGDPNDTDVVNVQRLDTEGLSARYHDVTNELLEMGEALKPRTAEGRELHSLRAALWVEMTHRGLL